MSKTARYSTLSRWLHWGSLVLVMGMMGAGTLMVSLADGDPQKMVMYRMHGALGFLLVLATVTRLVIRIRRPQPVPEGLPAWNQVLYNVVHWGIYLVLIFLGLSGMGTFSLNGMTFLNADPAALNREIPPVQGHFLFTRLLIVLVLLHVGGILRHQFTKGDVTGRMGLKLPAANQ
jgi:cytochrome b561